MLNLKELEKRLDDALAKETKESLTSWLMSKRFKNFITGSGEGEFDILLSKSSTLSDSNRAVVKDLCQSAKIDNNNRLAEAA